MLHKDDMQLELYRGLPVSVTLSPSGDVVEGFMKRLEAAAFSVDGRQINWPDQVRDLRLVGAAIGPVDDNGNCRFVCRNADGLEEEYALPLDNCGADFPAGKLEYGEFEVDADCHLRLTEEGNEKEILDVRFRESRHVLNWEVLEGKRFLYRMRAGSYFPAILIRAEDGSPLLRRYTKNKDGKKIPIDARVTPEEIEDITLCPKGGEAVQARSSSGAVYEGQVFSAVDYSFVLNDKERSKISYSSLAKYGGLRLIGEYHSEQHRYDGKYRLCPRSCGEDQSPPAWASFVVGVSRDGLIAKSVRTLFGDGGGAVPASENKKNGLEEFCGFIAGLKFFPSHGWIGKTYSADGGAGEIEFYRSALTFFWDADKVFAVRCYYEVRDGKKYAKKVELIEARDRDRVKSAKLDENTGKPLWELTDNSPLSMANHLIGNEVEVICRERRYCGYLWRVDDDAVVLGPTEKTDADAAGEEIPAAEITELWACGRIKDYRHTHTYGYIAIGKQKQIFFYLKTIPAGMRDDVETGSLVRFRVAESPWKGIQVWAPEVLVCYEKQLHEGDVVGGGNGLYWVALSGRESGKEIACVPSCALTWPGKSRKYVSGHSYRAKVEITLSTKGEVLSAVIRQIEGRIGYVKYYHPEENRGSLVNTPAEVEAGAEGPEFFLDDVVSPDRETAKTILSNRSSYHYIRVNYQFGEAGRTGEPTAVEIQLSEYLLKSRGSQPLPERLNASDPNFETIFNDRIATLLQKGSIDWAEAFLDDNAEFLDRTSYLEKRLNILSKRLAMRSPNAPEPQVKQEFVTCVDQLLVSTERIITQMHLLRQRGDLYYRCGTPQDKERGDADYRRWLELYPRAMAQLSRAKRENYKKERTQVEARLSGFAPDAGAGPDQNDELRLRRLFPWWIRSEGDEEDNPQYLWSAGQLERAARQCGGQGKENDRDWLEKKESELTAEENSAPWELAWVRSRLYHLNGEEAAREKWRRALAGALLSDAWEAVRRVSGQELDEKRKFKCRFLCVAALEILIFLQNNQSSSDGESAEKANEAAALYFGSVLLSQGMLRAVDSRRLFAELDEALGKKSESDFRQLRREGAILFHHVQGIDPEDLAIFKGLSEEERQALKDAGVAYGHMANDLLERVRSTADLSRYAEGLYGFLATAKYGEFLKDSGAGAWREKINSIVTSMRRAVEDYPKYTDFETELSRFFTQEIGVASATMEYLRGLGDPADPDVFAVPLSYWVIWDVYQPLVRGVLDKYMRTFSSLCEDARPRLILAENRVTAQPTEAGGYEIVLTIKNAQRKGGQTAQNVALRVSAERGSTGIRVEDLPHGKKILANDSSDFVLSLAVEEPGDNAVLSLDLEHSYMQGSRAKEGGQGLGAGRKTETQTLEITVQFSKEEFSRIDIGRIDLFNPRGIEREILNGLRDDELSRCVKKLLRNREEKVREITGHLGLDSGRRPSSVWVSVFGQWRVGKTTILNAVYAQVDRDESLLPIAATCPSGLEEDFERKLAIEIFRALREACKDFDSDSHEPGLWARKLLELSEAYELIDLRGASPESISAAAYRHYTRTLKKTEDSNELEDLAEVISQLSEELDLRVVLLLDEFTNVYAGLLSGSVSKTFFNHWLYGFLEKGNLLAVTAGGEFTFQMLEEKASNIANKAHHVKVSYLARENCDAIVDFVLDVSDEHPRFPDSQNQKDELLARIYKLTAGSPHLLVQLCKAMVKYVNEKEILYITQDVLSRAIDELRDQNEKEDALYGQLFKQLLDPYSENDLEEETSSKGEDPLSNSKVREPNKIMLQKLVQCAEQGERRREHECTETALRAAVAAYHQEDRSAWPFDFDGILEELVEREVLIKTAGDCLKIRVDLCYEMIARNLRGGNVDERR